MKSVWTIAIAAIAIAPGVVTGCGGDLPGPVLVQVQPNLAWNEEPSSITLLGTNFYPQVQLDAGKKGRSNLNNNYKVWLINAADNNLVEKLTGVEVISYGEISAQVPSGLVVGDYHVRVVGPIGRSTLDGAFEVSDSQADHLRVEGSVVWSVDEQIVLDIALLDRDDELVFKDPEFFPVHLSVTKTSGDAAELGLLTTTLVDAQILPDGTITGDLRRGHATVSLMSNLAQQVTVTVEANDRSNVGDGETVVVFQATDFHLEITLPAPNFITVAGEPFEVGLQFVDESGLNTDPASHDVVLRGTCSNFSIPVTVFGEDTVETISDIIRLTGTNGCNDEQITSAFDPAVSEPFAVLAAPIDHFGVQVATDPVAGEMMDVQLNARDAYGNPREWFGVNQQFSFQDSVGGTGLHSCVEQPFNVGEFRCTVEAFVAAPAIYLHVDGDDGTPGDSQVAYTVHPNPDPATVDVAVLGTPVAGEPFDLDVLISDAWDNLIDAAVFSSSDFQVVDELTEISCPDVTFGVDGSADISCTLVTARPRAILTVRLQNEGIEGTTPPIQVDNGPLFAVTVGAVGPFQATEVAAGDTLFLDFAGTDAYGNPYIVQTDPTLDIDDATRTLSVSNAVLGLDGTAQVQAMITVAGNTAITATQGNDLLGISPVVTILAADHDALKITVAEPWAWLGVPVEVRVESMDPYGNRTDWSGTATVDSRLTASPPLDITLTNGVGTDLFVWDSVALDEVLEASTPNFLFGESAPMAVIRDCPVNGPTADVTFGGFDDAIVCFIAGEGILSASFADSDSGGPPLISYALAADGPAVYATPQYDLILSIGEVGAHPLRALVAQSDGCADETLALAWVGLDDDHPVGPIAMTPVDATIDAGVGVTTIDIAGVVDCSRDPASDETVYVRTTRGEITGAAASGQGLEVTLDANGDASFTLIGSTVTTGGPAELHAWVASGAALGRADVDILGDNERPQVWEQDPTGETISMVSQIRLIFSEPMLVSQVLPGNFSVTGPSVATIDSVSLENGDTEVVITLLGALDGTEGVWSVTATDSLRDAFGNRLDGQWSGGRSNYVGTLGDVVDPGDSVSCAPIIPDGGVFRPDGDDGDDAETDIVSVELTTAVAPAWWVISVTHQASGDLIRRNYVVPSGAIDTASWDGRDASGKVVANGTYEIRVEPDDGLGNQGMGCTVVATVDNILGDVQ